MSKKSVFVTAIGMSLLGGCSESMVTSYPATTVPTPARPTYGEYGLARSVLVVSVTDPSAGAPATTSSGDASDSNKADTAAASDPAAAPAAPSAKIDAAAAKATAKAAKAAKAGGGAAAAADKTTKTGQASTATTQASWCADLDKTYDADQLATLQFAQAYNVFRAKLQGWIDANVVATTGQAAAIKAIEQYVAALKSNKETQDRASANILLINDHCPQPIKVELKAVTEADPLRTYRLYGRVNAFYSDHVTTEFDSGLLKTISATADSQASEIIVALAKTVAMFAMPGLPVTAAAQVGGKDFDGLDQVIAKIKKLGLTPDLLQQVLDNIPPDTPKPLPERNIQLPITRVLTLETLEAGPAIIKPGVSLVLRTECSSPPEVFNGTKTEGVLVSAERVCTFDVPDPKEFTQASGKAPYTPSLPLLAHASTAMADSRSSFSLPVESTTFVKRTTAYTFANGGLAKADVDYPSTAVEVVSLPLKVVGAFVGSIADGFKGKEAAIKAQTDKITAETERLKAAAAYSAAKAAANTPAAQQ